MIKRTLGLLLTLIGALGILLSALGIMHTWRAANSVEVAADDGLGLLLDTLNNVTYSLQVASTTLDDAGIAVEALHTTTWDVGETLSSTHLTLDTMAGLAEDDLPQNIESTLVALDAMEQAASAVDGTLRTLSLVGLVEYEPDVPLDRAIASVGKGLEPVPDDLRQMGDGLRRTGAGLEEVQGDVVTMGDRILDIRENVANANTAISGHRDVVQQLRERVVALRQNVRHPIRIVAWGMTLLLIWIGLSQLALIQWGIGLWQASGDAKPQHFVSVEEADEFK